MANSVRRTTTPVVAVFLSAGLSIGLLAASPSYASDPTPVPAPLVDIDGSEPSESSGPTAATTPSSGPSIAPPTTAPVPDSIGGGRLGETGVIVDLSAGAAQLPKVKARTWVLADANTGEVLAAKNAHKQRRPASTLKTLTALTLLPKLDPDATWTGTAKAQNTYGSKAGIKRGREYTISELFSGLLLPSGNDAALALAQANSTVKKTVAEMNQVAEELQAYDTTAKNTSGLDAKGQLSTAYDLALIGRAAIAREDFLEYVGSKRAEFPNPGKLRKNGSERKPIFVYNQNDLVMEDYRGAIGVKTGYTSKAGRTFIGAAKRGGTTLIVTLMGIREPSDEAARKLLNWGFKNRDEIIPVGELVPPLSELEQTDAEIPVDLVDQAPVATTASTQAAVASPAEPELASLSPTSWGWLAVFAAAIGLLLVGIIRRLVTRRQRRLLA
jgi:D-alanyl-D-alanine carboxypeptidase (penicillin-binding protein 5/6)